MEACPLIIRIQNAIVDPLITLLGILAFLLFVYGMVNFIRSADNEEKRTEGQRHMIWAIIGLVIIFGTNTLVGLIANTVGADVPSCNP